MSTNLRKFRFPCYIYTCDVVLNWSISLLPPIILDNLFASTETYSALCVIINKNSYDVKGSRMFKIKILYLRYHE